MHNSYYQCVLVGILLSAITTTVTVAVVLSFHVWNWRNINIPALIVSVNFMHILIYFSPFMLLAFMQDPLLTTLHYVIIFSYKFISIYLVIKFSFYMPLITQRCSIFVIYFLYFALMVLGIIMDSCIGLILTHLFALGLLMNLKISKHWLFRCWLACLPILYYNQFIKN